MSASADTGVRGVEIRLMEHEPGKPKISLVGTIGHDTVRGLVGRILAVWNEAGRGDLRVNFDRVDRIDSLGIAAICDLHAQLVEEDSRLSIKGANKSVRKTLGFMSIDTFIDVL